MKVRLLESMSVLSLRSREAMPGKPRWNASPPAKVARMIGVMGLLDF